MQPAFVISAGDFSRDCRCGHDAESAATCRAVATVGPRVHAIAITYKYNKVYSITLRHFFFTTFFIIIVARNVGWWRVEMARRTWKHCTALLLDRKRKSCVKGARHSLYAPNCRPTTVASRATRSNAQVRWACLKGGC